MTRQFLHLNPNIQNTLALVIVTTIGISIAWKPAAIADGIPGVVFGDETGSGGDIGTTEPTEQPITSPAPNAYTEAMLAGYAAAEIEDYQTALINFQRALEERPGDRYALAAIENMEAYIAQQRAEAERRRRFADLQQTLDQSIQASDWACAAVTVDELVTLVPPESLERARLVAYRGELSNLIDARADVNNWSTVCPG
ncbi:MAG: hypothetical protein AAFQ89_00575 [Cyanobacteria bacterium J06626_18]